MALYLHEEQNYIEPISTSFIQTGQSNLSELGSRKLLEFIDIDYIGSGLAYIYLDDILTSTIEIPSSEKRTTYRLYAKLNERKPSDNIYIIFKGKVDIYNIELDITPLEKY